MHTPHLVGVSHNLRITKDQRLNAQYLLNSTSAEKFRQFILPQLNATAVLFPEGHYENDVLVPGDRRYGKLCSKILGNIMGLTNTGVSLCFADKRAQLSVSQQRRYLQNLVEFTTYCARCIHVKKTPRTLDELLLMVRENDVSYQIVAEPTLKIKRIADELVKIHDAWTAQMIKRLTAVAQLSYHCFLVAGMAHCIDVHVKSGWPVQFLEDTTDPRILKSLFLGTVNVPYLGRVLRGY